MNFEQLKSHVLIILLKYTGIYIQSFHSSLEQIQNTTLKNKNNITFHGIIN